ncbi:MAG: ATP-dependent helicase, partial [Candidatus Moranbacteria bacterium]|nr:ATP-dependent helicase [Candidatus Moranbacteria bacterium]
GGDDLRLKDFLEVLEFELEAGDTGGLKNDFVDVDTVKIMTVHSAKGLEFKYVFLVDLVERRFPSDNRSERIPVHPALIKEQISGGDNFHIEEERRLFYVGLTRAKEGLFLTSAKNFGAAREKRPSAFIQEAGLDLIESDKIDFSELEFIKDLSSKMSEPKHSIPLREKGLVVHFGPKTVVAGISGRFMYSVGLNGEKKSVDLPEDLVEAFLKQDKTVQENGVWVVVTNPAAYSAEENEMVNTLGSLCKQKNIVLFKARGMDLPGGWKRIN